MSADNLAAKMENETMMEEDEKRAARCGNKVAYPVGVC